MPCNKSIKKSCCKSCSKPCKKDACQEADNQVTILRVGTTTKQWVIQLNCIKYVADLPGETTLTARSDGTWLLIPGDVELRDSNGNTPPLNDQETYCVTNADCRNAKFGIVDATDDSSLLPTICLEPGAFLVFELDLTANTVSKVTFGAKECCDQGDCCKPKNKYDRHNSVMDYNGGRSAGLITCNFPTKRHLTPLYRVAECPSKCCY